MKALEDMVQRVEENLVATTVSQRERETLPSSLFPLQMLNKLLLLTSCAHIPNSQGKVSINKPSLVLIGSGYSNIFKCTKCVPAGPGRV